MRVTRRALPAGDGTSVTVCLPIVWARSVGVAPGSLLVLDLFDDRLEVRPADKSRWSRRKT